MGNEKLKVVYGLTTGDVKFLMELLKRVGRHVILALSEIRLMIIGISTV